MNPKEDGHHDVPAELVPEIDAARPAVEFFRSLTTNRVGGAIVRDRPGLFYVTGRRLGEAIEAQAAKMGFEAATAKAIGDYLPQVATAPIQPKSPGGVADVGKVTGEDAVQSAVDGVEEGGLLEGLLAIQEAKRAAVAVSPPIWLCQDDDENTDPDHGDCAWCPRRIKGMKK